MRRGQVDSALPAVGRKNPIGLVKLPPESRSWVLTDCFY